MFGLHLEPGLWDLARWESQIGKSQKGELLVSDKHPDPTNLSEPLGSAELGCNSYQRGCVSAITASGKATVPRPWYFSTPPSGVNHVGHKEC